MIPLRRILQQVLVCSTAYRQEKAILQESTLDIYDLFIERVSTGRKMSVEATKEIAQGRVWTGKRGKRLVWSMSLETLKMPLK